MSSDMDALFEASQKVTASDTQIGTIARLIQEEREASSEIETALEMLSSAKERRRAILFNSLPEAMLGANMREFTTADGLKAKVVFLTDGALGSPKTEEERLEREGKINCIIEHGGGEIVKQTVTIEFPKEFAHMAEEIRERLVKLFQTKKWGSIDAKISRERTVNHMTLSSWIRERMESGDADEQLPPSFFTTVGIWYGEGAKIIVPKAKKA